MIEVIITAILMILTGAFIQNVETPTKHFIIRPIIFYIIGALMLILTFAGV